MHRAHALYYSHYFHRIVNECRIVVTDGYVLQHNTQISSIHLTIYQCFLLFAATFSPFNLQWRVIYLIYCIKNKNKFFSLPWILLPFQKKKTIKYVQLQSHCKCTWNVLANETRLQVIQSQSGMIECGSDTNISKDYIFTGIRVKCCILHIFYS